MVDEVFVTVRYQGDDFVRGRRLGLVTKAKDMGLVQLCVFLLLGMGGALFFAPMWLGQFVASAGGAVIGLAILVFAWGWLRAAQEKQPHVDVLVGLEVSDEGVVVKRTEGSARFAWNEFDRVAYGLGVFMLFGRQSVLIPRRVMRDDQFETLRALLRAHEAEVGQQPAEEPSGQAAPRPAAEEDDQRDGDRDQSKDE